MHKTKRNKYLRRLTLGLLVFITAMAQNVPWLPAIFGARGLPLIPLAVAIAVLEQEVPAILFGTMAGLCWDFSGESLRGWHAIFLTAVAFLCAALMRYVLNRNALTVTLLSLAATALYLAARWAYDALFIAPELAASSALLFYLPRLAYTMALLPACYLLVRSVVRKTSRKQVGERIGEVELGRIRLAGESLR